MTGSPLRSSRETFGIALAEIASSRHLPRLAQVDRARSPRSSKARRGRSRPRARRSSVRPHARARSRAPSPPSPRSRLGDAHAAQRIARVRVEAGRDEHQLRRERDAPTGTTTRRNARRPFVVAEAARHRDVDGEPAPRRRRPLLRSAPVPGIERKLVQRDDTARARRSRRCPACRCRGGRPSRRS